MQSAPISNVQLEKLAFQSYLFIGESRIILVFSVTPIHLDQGDGSVY